MHGVRRLNRGGHYILDTFDRPLTRVELHVHIDGCIRHETIFELAKEKNIPLPGRGSFEELVDYLVVKKPSDLSAFLSRFDIILSCLRSDLKALERIAYEFVEDCFRQGILYAEARYCPHLLIPKEVIEEQATAKQSTASSRKWVYSVTEALLRGLSKGKAEFGSKVNLIVTSIRGDSPIWFEETLELLLDRDFHSGMLCGLDVAALPHTSSEDHMDCDQLKHLFDRARKAGIHRTVHAGESGEASQVAWAIDQLGAERIGHGYRSVKSPELYDRLKREQVHLECCPWSSFLTGSVGMAEHPHPIVSFFKDGFNVSVNTDDPTITGTRMDDEYNLLREWGLSEAHFVRGNFNAAKSCFLPENEKKDLIQTLGKNYGVVML